MAGPRYISLPAINMLGFYGRHGLNRPPAMNNPMFHDRTLSIYFSIYMSSWRPIACFPIININYERVIGKCSRTI